MAGKDMGTAIFRAIADFSKVRKEARETERELAQLRREAEKPVNTAPINRKVKIEVDDKTKEARDEGKLFAAAFAKGVGLLSIGAPVIGGAGAVGLAGVANALTLAASLQPLLAVGLAIPGVMAGAAIGMGVLSSSLKDTKAHLGDLQPALQAMQQSMSGEFWYWAEKPLRHLTKALLPAAQDGLENIARAEGQVVAEGARAAEAAFGGGRLGRILEYTKVGIDALKPAMGAAVTAFAQLTEFGASKLPMLGAEVAKLADRWSNWISKGLSDGSLSKWFDAGIASVKDLLSIVGSALSMVGALVKAAQMSGATTTLGTLAAGFRHIADLMNGPTFQKALSTIFNGADKGASALFDSLGKIGEAFARGAPALALFLELAGKILGVLIGGLADAISNPAFGAGLNTFMEGLLLGVQALAPTLPAFTTAIGGLLAALAPIVTAIVPFLPEIAAGFVLWKAAMAGWALGGFIADVFAMGGALWGAAAAAWGFAVALLANPITWVVLAIVALVAALVWFFTQTDLGRQIWGGFVNWLKEVIDGFLVWWNTIFYPSVVIVFGMIGQQIAAFVAGWNQWWTIVWTVIVAIWSMIVAWIQSAVTNVLFILSVLGSLGAMAWEWFMGILNSIIAVGAAIFGFVASIPGTVIGWLAQLAVLGALAWGWFWGMVQAAMDTGGQLLGFVASIPGQVLGFLGDLGGLLIGAGQSLIQGFIDGVNSMIGAVGAAVGGVMDFIGGFFPHSPAERGAFSGKGWTPYRGKAVMDGFAEGILAGQQAGVDAAAQATTSISNQLNPVVNGASLLGAPPPGLGGPPPVAPGAGAPPAAPAAPAGAGGLNVTIVNPVPEPPSQSIQRTYSKIAYLGLDAKEPAVV